MLLCINHGLFLFVMLHIELPFVSRVGIYLENFAQKNQYLWNCSCPICGDMSKGRKKKRFYIYRPGTSPHLNAKCHHCGYSASFGTFLKEKFPEFYKEFVLERYQSSPKKHIAHKDIEDVIDRPKSFPMTEVKDEHLVDSTLDGLKCCVDLPDDHPVAKYIEKRMIPRDKWNLIYYTMKFKDYVNTLIPGKISANVEEHPRLVFPFFNQHGKVFAFTARAFDKREPKYYTIKLDDSEKIYGLDRIDPSKTIYALEGPVDSLFIPNAIAVAGSSFDCETTRALKSMLVLVPDNEPRSPEIVKIIKKNINLGFKVCMWPHHVVGKDINEMIKNGYTQKDVLQLIDENTFQGAVALLKFSQWKLV